MGPEIAQLYNASKWKYFHGAGDGTTVQCQQMEVFLKGRRLHNCTMPENGSIFTGPEIAQLYNYNASRWKYFYRA